MTPVNNLPSFFVWYRRSGQRFGPAFFMDARTHRGIDTLNIFVGSPELRPSKKLEEEKKVLILSSPISQKGFIA
jgi:hypothetical protein